MTYEQFGKRYSFNKTKKTWTRRMQNVDNTVVRLYMGYPGTEYFYLRLLLQNRTHLLSIADLMKHPEEDEEYSSYKEACVGLGLINSSKEFYDCVAEAKDMGFGSWKLLGLFAQMIICADVNNIGEIWNGPKKRDNLTTIEEQYPNGFKHLMMQFPKSILKNFPNLNYDYETLPNEQLKVACEQYTLRKLNAILERSGKDYPTELPKLLEVNSKSQTKEWLAAHNYDSSKAKTIYNKNKNSNHFIVYNQHTFEA